MKLNVGSGPQAPPTPEWITLDATAWPVKVRGDARALPFHSEAFEAVHCSHLVEHVPIGDVVGLLRECRRVMRRDGVLYVSGPDGNRARAIGNAFWIHITRRGAVTRDGWAHEWECSPKRLRELLIAAGFVPTWTTGVPQNHPQNAHQWPHDLESRYICRRDDFGWPQSFPVGYNAIA